jgi:ABC-type dipeptide/oligopeptide/nickel transport system permease component
MLKVIKSLFLLIVKDIKKNDDLLIYRPYERMLGLALFFYARQTPFILSNPKLRETIREAIGINQTLWEQYLSIIQQRMLETFGFFSHMQTCETYGYNTTFYIYLVLYSSKYNLFGHVDIVILK